MDNQQKPIVEYTWILLNGMCQPGWEQALGKNGYMLHVWLSPFISYIPIQNVFGVKKQKFLKIKFKKSIMVNYSSVLRGCHNIYIAQVINSWTTPVLNFPNGIKCIDLYRSIFKCLCVASIVEIKKKKKNPHPHPQKNRHCRKGALNLHTERK